MASSCIGDVRRTVLLQHIEIRARIRDLAALADGASSISAVRLLQTLLSQFAARFGAHLEFEERELAPRMREVDAWGPEREAALLAEHAGQRERIERVCALAGGSTPGGSMASEVQGLADSLLVDMTEEERALAELAEIEVYGHVDQMTG